MRFFHLQELGLAGGDHVMTGGEHIHPSMWSEACRQAWGNFGESSAVVMLENVF